MHVVYDHGSPLLRRRCNAVCTSGFVDDVTLSYRAWANGPESSTTLCFEEVRKVVVSVGRQTTTV